ncbi:MAG TPA: hypothetical protein VL463_25050 [Kofleriaceae bacterium]|nr:hypothetical protein [Kofleriaceae bacterium]
MTSFRLRDPLRDLVRVPTAGTIVIAAALAICIAPLFYYTIAASHAIAATADGRAAMKTYTIWFVVSICAAPLCAHAAAALIASPLDARGGMRESVARTIVHGVPALLAAALALALVSLGVVAAVITAVPLAAITFVAAPAAAVEQLGPGAAIRRSAELTRGARLRLALFLGALQLVQAAPIVIARVTMMSGKKPPVPPILRMQQLDGVLVIAIAVLAALVQVRVYQRLSATEVA